MDSNRFDLPECADAAVGARYRRDSRLLEAARGAHEFAGCDEPAPSRPRLARDLEVGLSAVSAGVIGGRTEAKPQTPREAVGRALERLPPGSAAIPNPVPAPGTVIDEAGMPDLGRARAELPDGPWEPAVAGARSVPLIERVCREPRPARGSAPPDVLPVAP